MGKFTFPTNFYWGTATASYQIEGTTLEDGRGECIWTRFSHTPGKTHNSDTGDIACDHYHRYAGDVELMTELGLNAYRFSTSWARVLPEGVGKINPAGLDFYDRLVDALCAANIQPFLTLFHWDLPQALQERGGWTNPDIVSWFSEYTQIVTRKLGDRVKHWMTLNEPSVVMLYGYIEGIHAPGIQDIAAAFQVTHHQLLAHGAAMRTIRENIPDASAGIALNLPQVYPLTESEADRQAARRIDGFNNRWYLDPVFKGEYPADMLDLFGFLLPNHDVRSAAAPLDFLGVNYYFPLIVTADENANPPLGARILEHEGVPKTAMGWIIQPEGLTDILVCIHRDYAPPTIFITENGAAFDDPQLADHLVQDPHRVEYYQQHLAAAARAMFQGVPLKGYFAWSLFDNFEWAEGYSKRFGIIYVDYATQRRIKKQSGLFYRDFIRNPQIDMD